MRAEDPSSKPDRFEGTAFRTTHWSVVLAAGNGPGAESHQALEKLCRTYWYPLYVYVRRRGYSQHDAQDLTQEFFARLIQKNYVAAAEQDKGRFRSFLLMALKRFLANESDRANRLKRGGGRTIISLDARDTETRYHAEPADEMTPEKAYERRWALTLLEAAAGRLRQEHIAAGKGQHFDRLKGFLADETSDRAYDTIAATMNISKGAVAAAVYRLRQRYRDLVRAAVADTVAQSDEVDDEVRHLFAALGY